MTAGVKHGAESGLFLIVLNVIDVPRGERGGIEESGIAGAEIVVKGRQFLIGVTRFFGSLPPDNIPFAPPLTCPEGAGPLSRKQPSRRTLDGASEFSGGYFIALFGKDTEVGVVLSRKFEIQRKA